MEYKDWCNENKINNNRLITISRILSDNFYKHSANGCKIAVTCHWTITIKALMCFQDNLKKNCLVS